MCEACMEEAAVATAREPETGEKLQFGARCLADATFCGWIVC